MVFCFRARESWADFPEFANEGGGRTVEAIGRVLAAIVVDPLREFLRMLSARHITLGFRTILVIRSHIAERPGDHGSGIDRIACSTFGPRGAGKVPLSQYGQILGGHLYRQGQKHYERYNSPLNARLHSSKLSVQASLLQKAK